MKKRLFVILLALAMVAGLSAVMLAANGDSSAVAKIGETEYATLGDAVAEVPTDGTETTITLLKSVTGGGVKVSAGQNIIFDFDGHTYTVGEPTVGSTNTETNGFQLLRDSTVTMKNGTLKASDYVNLKIMIQNYSDLTLLDMELDAREAPQCQYVASNNFGDVLITGDTSIYAANGQVAFDVYYWPDNGYGDGVSVTVDTTGTIEGTVKYGSDGSTTGKTDIAEKAPLVIKSGTIDGTISTYNLDAESNTGINITGGSFTSDVSKYVAEGNKLVDDGSGNYSISVDEETAIAEANGVGYTSLQAAIDAISTGEVTLLSNTTEDVIVSSGNITLNLNGCTLTNVSSDTISVKIGATLTVTGDGTVDNKSNGRAAIFNEGTVILNGGTYDRTSETGASADVSGGNSWYTICNHGTMTINEGVTVKNTGSFSSMIENGYYSYGSGNPRSGYVKGTNAANPSLIINNGSFIGGLNTVKNDDGAILEINGGTYTNTTQAAILNWNKATITNGTFECSAANCVLNGASSAAPSANNQGILTITGGSFTSSGTPIANHFTTSEYIEVSGGTFSAAIPSEFCPEGNKPVLGDDGNYVIGVDESTAIAEINGKGYTSLQNAINAAVSGQTIKLLTNITLTEKLTIDKQITIDGNGQYSLIKDADLKADMISLISGSDLLLTNITVDGKNVTGNYALIKVSGGKLTIGNGAVITGGTYSAVYLTEGAEGILAGGSITGNTFESNSLIGAGVTVNNGTFTMTSGSISDNSAPYSNFGGAAILVDTNGKAYLQGGEISGNTAYCSSAICVYNGYVELDGTEIKNNVADVWGGAISILWAGTMEMKSGLISGNIAYNGNAGAVYVEGGYNGSASFIMTGGVISGNMCSGNGGGIFGYYNTESQSEYKTVIDIQGGTISGNYEVCWWNGEVLEDEGILSSLMVHPQVQLKLSGTPTIADTITLMSTDYDDETAQCVPNPNFLPVLVANDFAPTSAIGINIGANPYENQAVIIFESGTADVSLFKIDWSGWSFKATDDGKLYPARTRNVVFKEGYYYTFKFLGYEQFIGETITAPTGTIKPGYTVEGWYTDINFKNKWDFENDVIPDENGNFVLYAKFVPVDTILNYPCSQKDFIEISSGITAPNGYTYKFSWKNAKGEVIGTEADISVAAPGAGNSAAYTLTVTSIDKENETQTYTLIYQVTQDAHTGGKATCTHQAKCSVCNERYGELNPDNHAYATEIRNAVAATAESEGYTGDTYCKGCGIMIRKGSVIPKLDHEHSMVKTDAKAATCTEAGNIEYYTCSVCGKLYKDANGTVEITLADTVIEATGHQYGSEYKHSDTEHWKECTVCGEKTDVAEHTFGEWVITKEATATSDGSKERTCSVCGATVTEVIPATGGETTAPTETTTPAEKSDTNVGMIVLWVVIALVVIAAVVFIILYMKKKKGSDSSTGNNTNNKPTPKN